MDFVAKPPATDPATQDTQRLRRAFGSFATGVAIVTARDAQGCQLGMTVNSLASLSFDPPLLLWSIARSSRNHAAFTAAGHFAVHVLHQGQAELSRRFFERDADRFAGLDVALGRAGVPLLRDHLICFQCETAQRFDGGDHTIVVGRVVATDEGRGEPLLFFRSRLARLDAS